MLVGGVRSGKSTLATQIGACHDGPVVFLATATALDDDMADRIARHRHDRPDWPTIEEPLDLAGALRSAAGDALVIVDCLTLWVANAMADGLDDEVIADRAATAAAVAAERRAPTVVVTNEVGSGVHPETELGRRYRDLLGAVNQRFAARSHRTLLVVAGKAVALADPWEALR